MRPVTFLLVGRVLGIAADTGGQHPIHEVAHPASDCYGPMLVYRYTDYRLPCRSKNSTRCLRLHFKSCSPLLGEDLHGYGIMRQVAVQTGGRKRLGPCTLYSSIQTLLEENLIEEVDMREDVRLGHERRRHYRLTPVGRKPARS